MGGACGTYSGDRRGAYSVAVEKREGERDKLEGLSILHVEKSLLRGQRRLKSPWKNEFIVKFKTRLHTAQTFYRMISVSKAAPSDKCKTQSFTLLPMAYKTP
jgi:hypothetical protein